jgi:hypothetical protein
MKTTLGAETQAGYYFVVRLVSKKSYKRRIVSVNGERIIMKRKRLQGCLARMAICILAFVAVLSIFLIIKPDVVYAVRNMTSIVITFARVEREIMQPTPYGRYYSELYFKHYKELGRILSENPPYRGDMEKLMRLYMPHIEATLDGRGHEIHITQEQVNELQTFFDQIKAVSNEEMRADIERELQRTPLQDFVGMDMDETLAHIENTWERDFSVTPDPTDPDWEIQPITPTP